MAKVGEVVVYYDTLEDPDFMVVTATSVDHNIMLAPMPRMDGPPNLRLPAPYNPTPKLGHWSFRPDA